MIFVLLWLSLWFAAAAHEQKPACWVWGKIHLSSLGACASLLFYQGDIVLESGQPRFVKRGFNPYQLDSDQPITIVIRFDQLVDIDFVADQALYLIHQWRIRGVTVNELQLDFDSPSTNLDEYSKFIAGLRVRLPDLPLSITGLATWVYDNPQGLGSLSESVDYIAMQLYRSYKPHKKHTLIANDIARMGFNYKLGITLSSDFDIDNLEKGSAYLGHIIFINSET